METTTSLDISHSDYSDTTTITFYLEDFFTKETTTKELTLSWEQANFLAKELRYITTHRAI
jgi:hypothetical protein